MRVLKSILTLLVLANWFACTGHCAFERTSLPASVTAGVNLQSQAACVTPEESHHICDWVLSGGYAFSETRVTLPAFAPHMDAVLALLHRELLSQEECGVSDCGIDPPRPISTFLFVCRTALPVRAPSSVS